MAVAVVILSVLVIVLAFVSVFLAAEVQILKWRVRDIAVERSMARHPAGKGRS